MNIIKTKFKDVFLIEPVKFLDHRGFFMESYNQEKYSQLGMKDIFVQDNHSLSMSKGILRGLHCQLSPKAQTKLVRVTKGMIHDVLVDIRKKSPTYKQWQIFELSKENNKQLYIPKGFLHGFVTLTDEVEVQYKVDEFYSADHEIGVIWNDSTLNIDWGIKNPILSDKDAKFRNFKTIEEEFNF
jgi:dTDP-4-dehydrorhamnose 3,5-epimerase